MAYVSVFAPFKMYSLSPTALERPEGVGHHVLVLTQRTEGGWYVRTACGNSIKASPVTFQRRVDCKHCARTQKKADAIIQIVVGREMDEIQHEVKEIVDALSMSRKRPGISKRVPPPGQDAFL